MSNRAYSKIAKLFESHGIIPINVEINWGDKKPYHFDDYKKQFLKLYKKKEDTEVYILGFSFGAMIALLVASKIKPKAIILCSLSPYFVEDRKNIKPVWLKWWNENFIKSNYSFTKLALNIRSKTYLIVGGEEHKACLIRSKDAEKKLPDSHLIVAVGAKHNVGQKEYMEAIKKVIPKLLFI